MNVGSAKIDVGSCPDVPHHMLDIADVSQPFSVLDYYNLALPVIQVSQMHFLNTKTPCNGHIFLTIGVQIMKAMGSTILLRVCCQEAMFHWW